MFDTPTLGRPLRLALLGGLALLAVSVTTVVLLVGSAPPPSPAPPPASPAASTLSPAAMPFPPPATALPPARPPDPNAWPADPEDRIRATQSLLRALKLIDEAPTGQPDASTRAAIRDYQRMAGLEETGEVSEALFDSLKELTAMVFPTAPRAPD